MPPIGRKARSGTGVRSSSKRKQTPKCRSGVKIPARPPPPEMETLPGRPLRTPYSPEARSPRARAVRVPLRTQAEGGASWAPGAPPEPVRRCPVTHRATWGRGGDTGKPGPFSPSLSQPLHCLASDYVYFAGHEVRGPAPGRFRLHLRRQCLLAPCAAQSRSLGRRQRPMRVPTGGAERAGPRAVRSRPPGQSR